MLCIIIKLSAYTSLEPRLTFGGGERESGTHCLGMCQNSQKSWEFIFLSIYQSANVNLDPRSMPKNRLYMLAAV